MVAKTSARSRRGPELEVKENYRGKAVMFSLVVMFSIIAGLVGTVLWSAKAAPAVYFGKQGQINNSAAGASSVLATEAKDAVAIYDAWLEEEVHSGFVERREVDDVASPAPPPHVLAEMARATRLKKQELFFRGRGRTG